MTSPEAQLIQVLKRSWNKGGDYGMCELWGVGKGRDSTVAWWEALC